MRIIFTALLIAINFVNPRISNSQSSANFSFLHSASQLARNVHVWYISFVTPHFFLDQLC